MADDPTKKNLDGPNRDAGGGEYSAQYEGVDLAQLHNLTPEQLSSFVQKYGNNREDLERAAPGLKRASADARHSGKGKATKLQK